MKPIILFRSDSFTEPEKQVAKNYFTVTSTRIGLSNSLVIARYSALPFYKELENDLNLQNSKLINQFFEHEYLTSFDYYYDLIDYTPKTWFTLDTVDKTAGPFILKGRINSRKNEWKTKMYAEDYLTAANIYCDLSIDPLLQDQGIIIRQFEQFKLLETGVNGQLFINEWRLFFYKTNLLSYGFYWTNSSIIGEINPKGLKFAHKIAEIVSPHVTFFALDIAELPNGEWRVIELNDGQMSGLSDNNPHELYRNLQSCLK